MIRTESENSARKEFGILPLMPDNIFVPCLS